MSLSESSSNILSCLAKRPSSPLDSVQARYREFELLESKALGDVAGQKLAMNQDIPHIVNATGP
jgi:hypothetical protein